jgi:hypothetical protein
MKTGKSPLAQFMSSHGGLLLLTVPSGARRLYTPLNCNLQEDPAQHTPTPEEWLSKAKFFHQVDRILSP